MKRELFTLMLHDRHGKGVEGLRFYMIEEEGKVQIQYWKRGKDIERETEQYMTMPVELLEGLMLLASAYQRKGMPFEEIPEFFRSRLKTK